MQAVSNEYISGLQKGKTSPVKLLARSRGGTYTGELVKIGNE